MKDVHFWQFKDNSCVKIENKFMSEILLRIFTKKKAFYKIAKQMKIDDSSLREIRKNPSKKIQLKTLRKIVDFANTNEIKVSLKNLEPTITWIGYQIGRGISNPKLPFKLNDQNFATVMSASFGDGTITNINRQNETKYKLGSFEYWNEDLEIRKNVIRTAIKSFGGNLDEYKVSPNRNSFVIFFPAIIRDLMLIAGGIRGEKSVSNPNVPSLIKEKSQMVAWLRQAFDDEGSVRYRNRSNHEIYLTRVTGIETNLSKEMPPGTKLNFNSLSDNFKKIVIIRPPNLLHDEHNFLSKFGIESRLKPQELYITKKSKAKVKWRLYITRKQNIKRFEKLIGFTSPGKKNILRKITGDKAEFATKNKGNTMGSIIGKASIKKMDKRKNFQIQFENLKENIFD